MRVNTYSYKRLAQPQGCELPPPEILTSLAPCDPCEPKCPPKTRARDAETIYQEEVERCFIIRGWQCGAEQIPAHFHCVAMKIRRKGHCRELIKLAPYRATPDGAACFAWPMEFLNLESGYYEGDLYIDGKTCATVLLYLPPCRYVITSEEAIVKSAECEIPAHCSVGEVPMPHIEIDPPADADCGDC